MTDEELDRDWKPNGRRPQSTIARSFSQELMDIFRIENSIADLDEQVEKRKQQVNTQTSELQALEARIREMERLLQTSKQGTSLDQRLASAGQSSGSPTSQRPAVASAFDQTHDAPPPPPEKDHVRRDQQEQPNNKSRPGTARQSQQAVPGALPPTPVASEDGDDE